MMTDGVIEAAWRLVEALTAENAALSRMDLAAAAQLLPEKTKAMAAFERSRGGTAPDARLRAVAERLRAAAAENRVRLARGMAVQTRVLDLLAQAARAAHVRPGYGRGGTRAAAGGAPGWALRAQA